MRTIGTARTRSLLIAVVAAVTMTLAMNSAQASALDGRVPDGRAQTPQGEITAYYWHGLNRDPDTGGLNNYMSFINQDCRWGVQDAGIKILDSAEAHNRWPTAQQMTGALYASLLNRGPDPGGFNTYVSAINARGLRWSITAMQASDEFHARLDRLCKGRASTNATAWNSYNGMNQAIQIHNGAVDLVKACVVGFVAYTVTPIKVFKGASLAIKAAKFATGQGLKVNGACGPAYQMMSAADRTAELASYEGANNPIFLQSSTRQYWNAIGRWCETWVRVGPNAMTWNGFKANYRC